MYGLFRCERCYVAPIEGCDFCAADAQWAEEVPDPATGGSWPVCRCCGQPANLLAPIVSGRADDGTRP